MTEAISARATHEEKGFGPMEFSVKKFDLLEELQLTQGVVERKTTIPILSFRQFPRLRAALYC